MQQFFTTEDTESTEKCQRILIYWERATGSPVQSDGFSDFNFFAGFAEKTTGIFVYRGRPAGSPQPVFTFADCA